ncbi:glycosyl hydrolase family 17 protein [Flavobacterium sp.]|uniref:glycoside hydrolase family 17 protein n=1 Tax=Flavobacterium sp. TaxID=239 RepID=UPI0035289BF5
MSFRKEQLLKNSSLFLNTLNLEQSFVKLNHKERVAILKEILASGVHGFCFSLYEEGQKPGDFVSEEQIIKRLTILKPYTNCIRTFSCTEGNEKIPEIAKQMGFKTLVGAWLGSDLEKNQEEINGLIKLAKNGYVDIAAVGNEVLYRKDLSEQQLLEYIAYTKNEIPTIPVGYVDAYYEFVQKPELVKHCDIILCNCYPYWEGTPFEHAINHVAAMVKSVENVANGKRIIITETGWPSSGESLQQAIPTLDNALNYFISFQNWAKANAVESYYFSSFDESWKTSSEGTVGAHWGIWDATGKLKF